MQGTGYDVVAFHCGWPVTKQMRQNSARLNGKKIAIKIKDIDRKMVSIVIFEIILYIVDKKLIMKTSLFFY